MSSAYVRFMSALPSEGGFDGAHRAEARRTHTFVGVDRLEDADAHDQRAHDAETHAEGGVEIVLARRVEAQVRTRAARMATRHRRGRPDAGDLAAAPELAREHHVVPPRARRRLRREPEAVVAGAAVRV